MDEQKSVGVQGQPEGEEWRPPPPYLGTPVLLMVFMTAATLFNVMALVVIPESRGLRYGLAVLTLAPVGYGWWVLARPRRRKAVTLPSLLPALLTIAATAPLSRILLALAERRAVSIFDAVPLVLYGLALFLFLLQDRLPVPLRRRGRR